MARGLALRSGTCRDGRSRQARGDLIEAIFLIRAYRTTLPRFGYSQPLDTGAMRIERRVSATYKDLPGGQLLGPTFDYTHRLIDPATGRRRAGRDGARRDWPGEACPRVTDILGDEGLIEEDEPAETAEPGDLTREPTEFPAAATCGCRRWRAATRASCWRSPIRPSAAMRRTHPFVGEIRIGLVDVEVDDAGSSVSR